ncbi:MAG: ribonuclease H-like domain-containing protein [bacterium]
MKIVLDIETAGYDFDSLTESQQEFILRYAEKEKEEEVKIEKREEAIRYLSLYPFTSKIIALGLLNIESGKSNILYLDNQSDEYENEDKTVKYKSFNEEEILQVFWNYIKKVDTIVTFNGKNFDLPFIMLRSAILKVKPIFNLMNLKKNKITHVDLQDALCYHNIIKKFNLDFYCNTFGIKSPKDDKTNGMEIKTLYKAGKIKEIAKYCSLDLRATYELYKIWNDYLNL